MKFDELNQLKRFFSTMELSEDEKKTRSDFAYLLYDAIYYVFSSVKLEINVKEKQGKIPTKEKQDKTTAKEEKPALVEDKVRSAEIQEIVDSYKNTLNNRLIDVFDSKGIPYEPEYLPRLVDDIIETTNRHPDEDYYLSRDRALLIAQNESNTAYNYVDYDNAVKNGKQYKVWLTENDERVRLEHIEVDGQKIPIDEMFIVGGEQMRYPHDYNASPQNIINCRCVCVYE